MSRLPDIAATADAVDAHLAEVFRAPKTAIGDFRTDAVMIYLKGIERGLELSGVWERYEYRDFFHAADACGLTPRESHLWYGAEKAVGREETLRRLESLYRPLIRGGFATSFAAATDVDRPASRADASTPAGTD